MCHPKYAQGRFEELVGRAVSKHPASLEGLDTREDHPYPGDEALDVHVGVSRYLRDLALGQCVDLVLHQEDLPFGGRGTDQIDDRG